MKRTLLPGQPYPLGATVSRTGVNFAIYSEGATKVDLCLFDPDGKQTDCLTLHERTAFVWHGFVRDIKPGQLYGYRIDGPWDPAQGSRFNPNKLLIDPYAEAISGRVDYKGPIFPYDVVSGDDLKIDTQDSAPSVPKSVVVDSKFDWGEDCPPATPLSESVIYECHVRGFSIRNPAVPEKLRGTYAGLAHPSSIDYFKKLGVTAIELLPIHHFIDEGHLVDHGLVDYWGYNTLGYFAPMSRYSSSGDTGGQVNEFKAMVKAFHEAGIEVILDVVYNHTCEGNEKGPVLSWKGVCNKTYYRTVEDDPRFYMDYTGTGNTLNVRNPQVLKMLMDSLRYWVDEMHVDGFRFDLAATLARELHDVSKLSSFFDTIHQDPTISRVKLIAEPWDVGEGGYQVGQFPVLWAEWNGKYRDTIRRFWKGDEGLISDFAYRLTGSSDLYQMDGRRPYASINFITAHDGFTLCDLVSYNDKHNEANGEDNNDGNSQNDSWNMGAEGPTDDPAINELRERQMRNFIATLLLSQGVPMISGGDEVSRSQRGNNNCYCQDNELTWYDWKLDASRERLLDFTSRLIKIRRDHPNLHRRKFFQDRGIRQPGKADAVKDIYWYDADGSEISDDNWNTHWVRSLGAVLNGTTLQVTDEDGNPVIDDSFLLLINAAPEGVEFKLPPSPSGRPWMRVLDTENIPDPFYSETIEDETLIVGGRVLKLLCDHTAPPATADEILRRFHPGGCRFMMNKLTSKSKSRAQERLSMLERKFHSAIRHYRTAGIKGVYDSALINLLVLARSRNQYIPIDGCVVRMDGIEKEARIDLLTKRYELSERRLLKKHLRPDLPVIEFGGSIGVISCITNKQLADPSAHVVVEANPGAIPFLTENRDRNSCKFEILNRAVAYGADAVTFRPSSNMCASSLLLEGDRPAITVPAIRLRDIVDERNFLSYTLICDIEGIEYDLISNEMDTLKKAERIILETHARFIGDKKMEQMMNLLSAAGFKVLDEDGFVVALGKA